MTVKTKKELYNKIKNLETRIAFENAAYDMLRDSYNELQDEYIKLIDSKSRLAEEFIEYINGTKEK